ncbi:hypothetical protein J3E69DRAFT_132682 [Trichoderma sp. SZMC 28015]
MLRQQLAQYRLFRLTAVRNPSPQRHNRLSQFVIPGAFWTGDGKGFNLVIFFSSLLLVLYLWSPLFCRVLVLSVRQATGRQGLEIDRGLFAQHRDDRETKGREERKPGKHRISLPIERRQHGSIFAKRQSCHCKLSRLGRTHLRTHVKKRKDKVAGISAATR